MPESPSFFDQTFAKSKKVAFIFSPQLGDSLISMVTAYNLRRNNIDVTVFSDYMFALRGWFANDKIYSYPEPELVKPTLASFDVLVFTYPHDIIGQADLWHPQVIVLSQLPINKKGKNIVDLQVAICDEGLHLDNLVRVNDLTPPKNLEHHKYKQRVAIHPTSRQEFRSWPKKKFIKLAKELQGLGFQPSFVMSPFETKNWLDIKDSGLELPSLSSLDQVAAYIYESRWFIGNDSGLGHLASNLGLNTMTLAVRPGLAKLWRPSWMPGTVVLPPWWLITRPLKEKFWKNFISVSKALNAFLRLTQKPEGRSSRIKS